MWTYLAKLWMKEKLNFKMWLYQVWMSYNLYLHTYYFLENIVYKVWSWNSFLQALVEDHAIIGEKWRAIFVFIIDCHVGKDV